MNLEGCSALITGASAGIGREFARQLASRARALVILARREQRLNELREELRNRNVRAEEIESHAERRSRESQFLPDGTAIRCSFCHRPAEAEGWGWHRLWGRLPVFRYLERGH